MAYGNSQVQLLKLEDFSGGLNSNELSSQIKDNEGEPRNTIWYDGSLQLIPGSVRFEDQVVGSDAGTAIRGLHQHTERDGTNYLIIATASGLFSYNITTRARTDIEGSLSLSDHLHSFATFNDKLVGTNYTDEVYVWSGTGNAGLLSSETGSGWAVGDQAMFIAAFNSRLCYINCQIGGAALPASVIFSDIDKVYPTSTSAQEWNFDGDDGDVCMGGAQLGEKLIIFLKNRIGYVAGYGTQSFTVNRNWRQGVGCVSGYSIENSYLNVGGKLVEVIIFLSQEGYRAIDESGTIYLLPVPESKEEYKCFEYFDGLDLANVDTAVGCFYRKRNWYYGFFRASGSSSNDIGAIYDHNTNSLWPLNGIDATCCCQYLDADSGEWKVMIGSSDGFIYMMSETTKGIDDSTELLTNGDFEDDSDGDTTPTSWTKYGTTATFETDDDDTISPYNGTKQLKIVTDAVAEGAYQDITTVIGAKYRVVAYIYPTTGECQIGKEDTDTTNATTGTNANTLNAWTKATVSFTATATTSRITFKSVTTAASTYYIDDVAARLIDVDAYFISKYYDFGDEHAMKLLREFDIFASATDTGGITCTLTYDKGLGSSTSDTITLTTGAWDWTTTLDWTAELSWVGYEELTEDLDSIDEKAFRTLKFKIETNPACLDMKFNRVYIPVLSLNKRFTYDD